MHQRCENERPEMDDTRDKVIRLETKMEQIAERIQSNHVSSKEDRTELRGLVEKQGKLIEEQSTKLTEFITAANLVQAQRTGRDRALVFFGSAIGTVITAIGGFFVVNFKTVVSAMGIAVK